MTGMERGNSAFSARRNGWRQKVGFGLADLHPRTSHGVRAVMEGSAYTNKIDVYSFGVVLTEIFNRQIPLRDQYKIISYV
jgi:hypothetical protein